mgnify:CR=1 FL=1
MKEIEVLVIGGGPAGMEALLVFALPALRLLWAPRPLFVRETSPWAGS